MKYLLVVLILCSSLLAQTAKIVVLRQSAAEEVKQTYTDKVKADAAWDKLVSEIKDEIALDRITGFSDIEFSMDFRFVVPKPITICYYNCFLGTTCPTVPLTTLTASPAAMSVTPPGTYETWIDSITSH